ncbi:hypothetical protein Leryth_011756, partial [Lithospermum erythrorhizon]
VKLLYIVVVEEEGAGKGDNSFRYTRSALLSTLQLMGCKAKHSFKISKRVFQIIRSKFVPDKHLPKKAEVYIEKGLDKAGGNFLTSDDDSSESKLFELYKRRTTAVVSRKLFLDVVCNALTEYKYVGPNQRADLILACRIRERKDSVIVLLCGTSGCGKSTLSALLASRLGITTVISTDSIRHMMRSFVDEKQNPLLWSSTYHAGEHLDPVAVSEAKYKRKAKKLARAPCKLPKDDIPDVSDTAKLLPQGSSRSVDLISPKQMAIEGFKAQSEMVIDSLDRLISTWEEQKESVVVEGVHLSLNFVMGLMKKHPSIIPFMIYISNEEKHVERFAVRAKYMTLDPAKNKYVKYIKNIRTIQEYLCNRADKHLVPKINNTNVDRSVAAIHATVFSCLRRRHEGEQIYDPIKTTVAVVSEEYKNQCTANSLRCKGMFQLIQRKGSSRHLMALLNNDGSVAKAWPVDMMHTNGKSVHGNASQSVMGIPMYGPLKIGKAEPVNLQFGHFGITAWPNDTGGSSHSCSFDESRAEFPENGSRCPSSVCSSPRFSEGHAKELKEEESVHGSDEEADDSPEPESDEDLSDDGHKQHEEIEGSVDEDSTRSDEEYDEMEEIQENGYMSDEEEVKKLEDDSMVAYSAQNGEIHDRNINPIVRAKSENQLAKPQHTYSSILREKLENRPSSFGSGRLKRCFSELPVELLL